MARTVTLEKGVGVLESDREGGRVSARGITYILLIVSEHLWAPLDTVHLALNRTIHFSLGTPGGDECGNCRKHVIVLSLYRAAAACTRSRLLIVSANIVSASGMWLARNILSVLDEFDKYFITPFTC